MEQGVAHLGSCRFVRRESDLIEHAIEKYPLMEQGVAHLGSCRFVRRESVSFHIGVRLGLYMRPCTVLGGHRLSSLIAAVGQGRTAG